MSANTRAAVHTMRSVANALLAMGLMAGAVVYARANHIPVRSLVQVKADLDSAVNKGPK